LAQPLLIVVGSFVHHKIWDRQAPEVEIRAVQGGDGGTFAYLMGRSFAFRISDLENLGHSFFEYAHFVRKPLLCGKLPQPTGRFVQVFKR
jgi:hypothetical protein